MIWIRYVLPGALVALGVASLGVDAGGIGVDLFAMLVGAGLAVALMNLLFRAGARGDLEREDEQAAREFYAEHGRWPDETPRP